MTPAIAPEASLTEHVALIVNALHEQELATINTSADANASKSTNVQTFVLPQQAKSVVPASRADSSIPHLLAAPSPAAPRCRPNLLTS
jgi:hypothetical protein